MLEEDVARALRGVDADPIYARAAGEVAGEPACARVSAHAATPLPAARPHAPFVMIALVSSFSLNSCAANLSTAVKGAPSGTLMLRGGRAAAGERVRHVRGREIRPGAGPRSDGRAERGQGYAHAVRELWVRGERDLERHLPFRSPAARQGRRTGLHAQRGRCCARVRARMHDDELACIFEHGPSA